MPQLQPAGSPRRADAKGWALREDARSGDMGSDAQGDGDHRPTPYAIDVNLGWRLPFIMEMPIGDHFTS